MSFPGPDSGGREAARNMGMKTGKLPVNAMKRSVFGQIRRNREEVLNGAGAGEDCAIFSSGPEETAAVCVQEAVLRTAGAGAAAARQPVREADMALADLIVKCANNLAAGGAEPVAATVALLLPETVEEPQIRALMVQTQEKCTEF